MSEPIEPTEYEAYFKNGKVFTVDFRADGQVYGLLWWPNSGRRLTRVEDADFAEQIKTAKRLPEEEARALWNRWYEEAQPAARS